MTVVSSMSGPTPGGPVGEPEALKQLREVSGRIVGSVFFGTLLEAMRNSPFRGKYGHGGRGEDIFAAQLHEVMAEQVGRGTAKLGDVLYQHLSHQQELLAGIRSTASGGPE